MNEDGSFLPFRAENEEFAGKEYSNRADRVARQGYFNTADVDQKQYGFDAMWYLSSSAQSTLYGKDKMATFEHYFMANPATYVEKRNAYCDSRDSKDAVRRILEEFGLDPDTGHLINGHVPVRVRKGKSPARAAARLIVVDGGLAKAYQR